MDKKRLRVALTVLEAVKNEYPETKKFIENLMDEECQKEKISADEVIFFTSLEAKSYLRKTFLFCSEYVKRYFIKLNSLGYIIFTHVLSRYLDLVYQKLLRFFTDKANQRKQFCKNDGYGVLLQLLIV